MVVKSTQEMSLSVSIIFMLITIAEEMLSHLGDQNHINSTDIVTS